MPGANPSARGRTAARWPYRAAPPARRRRVVRADAPTHRGVLARVPGVDSWRITPRQARIAIALAGLLMLLSAGWWTYHSPWLTVRHITISGTSNVPAADVRAAAGVSGNSIFSLGLHAAELRIEALPRVRHATVTKDGVNAVRIAVEERTAWGSWQAGGTATAIDEDGFVLDGAVPEGAPKIVIADDATPAQAGAVVDADAVQLAARLVRESDSAFGRTVLALVYRHDTGLTAVLSGPSIDAPAVWVTFGDSRDYDYKIATLYVLFQRAQQDDLALNVVDLRYGDRLSFR